MNSMDDQKPILDEERNKKICVNPDCGVVVLNHDWHEKHCRDCGTILVKINQRTFEKKFTGNRQAYYLEC